GGAVRRGVPVRAAPGRAHPVGPSPLGDFGALTIAERSCEHRNRSRQDGGVQSTFCGRPVAGDRAMIMAIVNRTPDSFYDRGATFADAAAKSAVHRVIADGADVIDVGGVKAGPGSGVDADEEIARVVPFIEWLRDTYPDQLISVDTWRA